MATPYIIPLGFIDRTTDEGTVFLLTNPEDFLGLKLGTPITVWRYSQEHLALAKLRGAVTAIGYTTATFTASASLTDPRWPQGEPILVPAAPVFMDLEGSYDPDPARKTTPEKAEAFQRYAKHYAELTALPGQAPAQARDHNPDSRRRQGRASIKADNRTGLTKSHFVKEHII